MTDIEISNQALSLIGHGRKINSLDDVTPEAESCKLLLPQIKRNALSRFDFSFARRDEVIGEDELDESSNLPYEYAYNIPEDVLKILYVGRLSDSRKSEQYAYRHDVQFNFRNVGDKMVLVTDEAPPIVLHYQANITDMSVASPMFLEGIINLLAAKLCTDLIKGTVGMEMYAQFFKLGTGILQDAIAIDAQQSAPTRFHNFKSSFVFARR